MSDLPAHHITERQGIAKDGTTCIIRKYQRPGKLSWTLQFNNHAELADWNGVAFIGRESGVVVLLKIGKTTRG